MSLGNQLSEECSRAKDEHLLYKKKLEPKKSMKLQERIHMNRIESEKKVLITDIEKMIKVLKDMVDKSFVCHRY